MTLIQIKGFFTRVFYLGKIFWKIECRITIRIHKNRVIFVFFQFWYYTPSHRYISYCMFLVLLMHFEFRSPCPLRAALKSIIITLNENQAKEVTYFIFPGFHLFSDSMTMVLFIWSNYPDSFRSVSGYSLDTVWIIFNF